VTVDLRDSEDWISRTDPRHYFIQPEDDTEHHVTMMDRLRQSIRKLSFSFGNNTPHGNRRRSSIKQSPKYHHHRPVSYQPMPPSPPTTNIHRLSQPTMSKQPSYSTSLLPHATSSVRPTVSLSTGHTLITNSGLSSSIIPPSPSTPLRPISYLSDDSSSIIHEEAEEEECNHHMRPDISRRVSSASSSSGLGLTFGKYRGGMTPMEPIVPNK
jgi:hypothetical protein